MAAKAGKKPAKKIDKKKSTPAKAAPKKSKVAKAAKPAPKKKPSTTTATTKTSARVVSADASETKKSRQINKPRSSSGTYTQSEFIEHLCAFCGLSKKSEARELVHDISALVTESLKKGYKLPLFGLGKLFVRKSDARKGRNPATGEEITIPARKRVRFTPAKALKDSVL
jgi:DNA-binding protein HU-beta